MALLALLTLTVMLICYAFEERSHWFTLAISGALVLGSVCAFIKDFGSFGLIEAVGSLVVLRRWRLMDRK